MLASKRSQLLRAVALYTSPGTYKYKRPLKKYLNDFAAAHRSMKDLAADMIRSRFREAVAVLNAEGGPGREAFRSGSSQVNAALTEAVLVGLLRRLDDGTVPPPAAVGAATRQLLDDAAFVVAISRATADEDAVRTRLAIATRTVAAT